MFWKPRNCFALMVNMARLKNVTEKHLTSAMKWEKEQGKERVTGTNVKKLFHTDGEYGKAEEFDIKKEAGDRVGEATYLQNLVSFYLVWTSMANIPNS